MSHDPAPILPAETARLCQPGLPHKYVALAWNAVGAAVVIVAVLRAGSAALAGFGPDSLIEIFASTIVVWQLRGAQQGRERTALRLIGAAFFMLAAYVLALSAWVLLTGQRPGASLSGMVWLAATVMLLLLLAWGKLVTGRRFGHAVLRTEARVTLVDAYSRRRAGRRGAEWLAGLIVGRSGGWARDRLLRSQGGLGSLAPCGGATGQRRSSPPASWLGTG